MSVLTVISLCFSAGVTVVADTDVQYKQEYSAWVNNPADTESTAVTDGSLSAVVPVPEAPAASQVYTATDIGLNDTQLLQLKSQMRDAIMNSSVSLDISSFNIPYSQNFSKWLSLELYNTNPEYFHLAVEGNTTTFYYNYNSKLGYKTITKLVFYYRFNPATTQRMWNEINLVVDDLTHDLVNSNLSNVNKALLLHDRLIAICQYDIENYNLNQRNGMCSQMYGALVNGLAMCQGYSLAYKYLLEQVGISSYLCSSKTLDHVWNIVYISGVKFHVDVTWDDPIGQLIGNVNHENFMRSTEGIKSTGHDANDFDMSPTNTWYDNNQYWQESFSEILYLNGDLYYMNKKYGTLTKIHDGSHNILYTINDKWPYRPGYSYIDKYSALCSDGVNVYFNTPKTVLCYYPSYNTTSEIRSYIGSWDTYTSIFALRIVGNKMIMEKRHTNNVTPQAELRYFEYTLLPTKPTLIRDGSKWVYVKNGQVCNDNTVVKSYGTWYHVKNGTLCFDEDVLNFGGTLYYVNLGVIDFTKTGLVQASNGTWYYVKNGIVDTSATTLVKYGGKWYYVQNGVLKWGAETLVRYYGTWYYVKNSTVDFSATTLCSYYGTWYYVKNGIVDFSATTLVRYGGKWYYVQKGVLKWGAETLVKYYGTWYYVKNSSVDFSANTLVKYGNTWYFIQNGTIKWDAETLVNYYGTCYYVRGGAVDFSATTLCQYKGIWYYVQNGIYRPDATTLVKYCGTWYYVRGGTVDWQSVTTVNYGGTNYFVRNGKVDWTYTGYLKRLNGTRVYIVNGIVR